MAYQFYIIFAIPLIVALAITPMVIWFATRVGALDQPNERKIHKYPIPRLGGIAIYISFFVSLVFLLSLDPALHAFSFMNPHDTLMLVLSLTIVLILGIWDDLRQLRPGQKFLGQFIAGTIVYLAGFKISSITYPFGSFPLNLSFFDYPVTLLWIVGITNAFNLIDGLDGLASGVAFIVSLTIFTISYLTGSPIIAMMALILAGAVLGFLPYNFNKARIFLGDSGSLFIGFTLAILSIKSSTKGSTAFSMIVPMLTLGLPIMDTLLSMTRRLLKSLFPNPQKPDTFLRKILTMFLPDR
jgi:UDP-GlcNAc:undecaprenyl-phosphate GlcNAc-1-phosphate transferase